MLTDPKGGQRWIPLMQNAAKVGECDWFWVASATSTNVIGAPCLSNERYPPAKPRPALRTLPLTYPVIDKVTKSGKPTIIERYLRTKLKLSRALLAKAEVEDLFDSDDSEMEAADDFARRMEVEADKCVLPLMEEACRTEHNMRGLDLASRLNTKVSFKYAIELARHFKRAALATRVEQVALRKMEVMEDAERGKRKRGGEAASPVTPGGEAHEDEDEDEGDGAVVKDEGATTEAEEEQANEDAGTTAKHVRKTTRVPAIEFEREEDGGARATGAVDMADVTDDEEEPVRRPETSGKRRLADEVEERAARKRKMRADTQASQASVKGGGAVKRVKTSGGAPRKAAPRNRFLKK